VPIGDDVNFALWLPNVWLGVSVEDQKTADERIPLLLQTPAAVRWISAEPLLGPINFAEWMPHEYETEDGLSYAQAMNRTSVEVGPCEHCGVKTNALHWTGVAKSHIDWIVVGGESGPHARPFNIQWARDIIAQCKAAGVACFVKQLGSVPYGMDDLDGWGDSVRFESVVVGGPNLGAIDTDEYFFYLKDRKGSDPSEWPEDLRVREYPSEVTA
jgi:hypothetical protein